MVYIHFQKAAGTTVEDGLKRFTEEFSAVCGVKKAFSRPSGSNYRKSSFSSSHRNADIIAGHGYWGCHAILNPSSSSPYIYTAFFRNPVDRALSHFARSSCKREKRCSIRRFLQLHAKNYYYNRLAYDKNLVDAGKYGENLQTVVSKSSLRRNREGGLLKTVKKRIEDMPFVGLVEEFDASMLLFGGFLQQYFNFPSDVEFNLFYCRSHNSFKSSYKTLESEKKELGRHLWLDHEIFQFAVDKFNQQKKAYGKDFEEALETFRAKQTQYDSLCCRASNKKAQCSSENGNTSSLSILEKRIE